MVICVLNFPRACLLFPFFKPVSLLTSVTCLRIHLNTSLHSVHSVRADVSLLIDHFQGRETSPHFIIYNQQFQGIYYNLYGKIVFTCLFFGSLEFLVTRIRIECCVVFIVRLCLLYTNVMCNNAFKT